MPKPQKFLEGFGLHEGLTLAGYRLMDIQISHEQVKRYQEYKYPLRLTFDCANETNDTQYQQLYQALVSKISGDKTIYTEYGNPYKCTIEFLYMERCEHRNLVVHLLGHAERIRG